MDCLLPSYQQRHSVGTQGRDGNEPTGQQKPREKRAEKRESWGERVTENLQRQSETGRRKVKNCETCCDWSTVLSGQSVLCYSSFSLWHHRCNVRLSEGQKCGMKSLLCVYFKAYVSFAGCVGCHFSITPPCIIFTEWNPVLFLTNMGCWFQK